MSKRSRCVDCHTDTCPTDHRRAEYYVVHDHIWKQAGMAPFGGMLCIGCLEQRIGRTLNAGDFDDCELNDLAAYRDNRYAWAYRTPRLERRLTAATSTPIAVQPSLW